jgi:hypothetical protein
MSDGNCDARENGAAGIGDTSDEICGCDLSGHNGLAYSDGEDQCRNDPPSSAHSRLQFYGTGSRHYSSASGRVNQIPSLISVPNDAEFAATR